MRISTATPILLLAAAIAIAAAPSGRAQATGSLSGVVTTKAAALKPVRVTIDQRVCGTDAPDEAILADAQGRLANAVVILTGVKAQGPPPEPMIMNERCRFAPRVQIARPNAAVKTSSKDPVLHTTNAQQNDTGRTLFNVALPAPGITLTKPIAGAGIVRIGCNTHTWMRGWMVVTDELAAVTGADGRFTLAGVPPGTYELRVWHEALKAPPQKVIVGTGSTAETHFDMR
jgi:hypothetical protein